MLSLVVAIPLLIALAEATKFTTLDVYYDAAGELRSALRERPNNVFQLEGRMCLAPRGVTVDRSTNHAPWTSPPQCVTGYNWDTQDQEEFCIFTKKDFAEGRGISVFASAQVAEEIASMRAFTDPTSIIGANDASKEPFYKVLFPNKGYGLVANRTIFRGERIMQETSAWIYDRDAFVSLHDEVRVPLQWNMAYQLTEGARADLLALHGHHGDDELDDIMRTNAFGTYWGQDRLHNNLFPRLSRFNHDCRPNAHYYFDKDTMTQYVNAIRKIEQGEEILINYTDGEAFSQDRKAAIKDSWGFECDCSICRQHPEALAASDARLAAIKELKPFLENWDDLTPDRPRKAELLANLYELERLDVPAATAYEAAAYAYAVFGNEYKTVEWAAKAVEAMTLYYGASNPMTVEMEKLMNDPRGHRTWKYAAQVGIAKEGKRRQKQRVVKEEQEDEPKETKKGWF